jgi:hypothetical protein
MRLTARREYDTGIDGKQDEKGTRWKWNRG